MNGRRITKLCWWTLACEIIVVLVIMLAAYEHGWL